MIVRLPPALLLGVLFTSCATTSPEVSSQAATLAPAERTGWHADRHAAQKRRAAWGGWEMLFVGDSITQSWEGAGATEWRKRYELREALNLGISGDRTQHVLWKFQDGVLDGLSPKLAVVMIGTNNAGFDSSEDIAAGMLAVVEQLRTRLPDMHVLVLAVFPRGSEPSDELRRVNEGANRIVEHELRRGADPLVHWLDIGPAFLEDAGYLSREVMPDLLHLSPDGYRRWADAIEPVVEVIVDKPSRR